MARRANPRAAAQRRTARQVAAQREARAHGRQVPRILPKAITAPSRQAQIDYANAVLRGDEPYPSKNSAEGRQLARMASLARWQKAPPEFEQAFSQYWYHKEGEALNEEDEIDYDDLDEQEEE